MCAGEPGFHEAAKSRGDGSAEARMIGPAAKTGTEREKNYDQMGGSGDLILTELSQEKKRGGSKAFKVEGEGKLGDCRFWNRG